MLPYPDVTIPNNTRVENAIAFHLAVVESPSQAQRIAKQALQRRQYDRSFTAPFDIRAWKYPVGTPVPFTFPLLGFDRQVIRVAEQEIGPEALCNMTLSFETDEIYQWDADAGAPVKPAKAVTYDPSAPQSFRRSTRLDHWRRPASTRMPQKFPTAQRASRSSRNDRRLSRCDFLPRPLRPFRERLLALPQPATSAQVVDPDNVIIQSFGTSNADGTYPPSETPPGGYGGGGYGGGGGRNPNMVEQ